MAIEREGYIWNYCKKNGCHSAVYINGDCAKCALRSKEIWKKLAGFFEDIKISHMVIAAAFVGAFVGALLAALGE